MSSVSQISSPLQTLPQMLDLVADAEMATTPQEFGRIEQEVIDHPRHLHLLAALIDNADWEGHAHIPLFIWREFIKSLPKDGSRDVHVFSRICENFWPAFISLASELNSEDFDLVNRFLSYPNSFVKLFPKIAALSPEKLVALAYRYPPQEKNIPFWENVYHHLDDSKYKALIAFSTVQQLHRLFDGCSGINDEGIVDEYDSCIEVLQEVPALFDSLTMNNNRMDLTSTSKAIALITQSYVEKFNKIEKIAHSLVELTKKITHFSKSLSHLNRLKKEGAFNEEDEAKISKLFKDLSLSKHFDFAFILEEDPVKAFMHKCHEEQQRFYGNLRLFCDFHQDFLEALALNSKIINELLEVVVNISDEESPPPSPSPKKKREREEDHEQLPPSTWTKV